MRPVDKSLFLQNKPTYAPYGKAKDDLVQALGGFCSYCERQGNRSALAVEHIEDKSTYPEKEHDWDNFLLSCVNCNSIKATKDVTDVLLPDRDNTSDVFVYLEGGCIQVSPMINGVLKLKAEALIKLVGLDRTPNRDGYSGSDDLWMGRKKNWELAQRYLFKYQQGACDKETIIDLALSNGFWSIWMQVFDDFIEVKNELLIAFPGTNQTFFHSIIT